MAIKVEASRFAVLRIEDDDDSDEKDSKQKQSSGKGGQQSAETKKRNKRKKKAEQSRNEAEELRKLAFNRASKKSASHSSSKSGIVSDSQWELWQKKSDESVDKEFEKELNDALLQSRLEFEEKQRTEASKSSDCGNENKAREEKKKKTNKPTAVDVDQMSNKRVQGLPEDTKGSELQKNASRNSQIDKFGATEKLKQAAPAVDVTKKVSIKDYKAAILQKEEEIKELREINKTIEAEVAEVKKKNQLFCSMLGQGEMMDKATIKAELEELCKVRDNLTSQVAQCSSELEKERSKSHALKAERDKLKASKQVGK